MAIIFLNFKNIKIKRTFSYNKTISRYVYNYNKIPLITEEEFNSIVCKCSDKPEYINESHGHIITGDYNIIDNEHLKMYMKYGAKYHINLKCNKDIFISNIHKDLDLHIYKTALKYNQPIEAFNNWKYNIIDFFLDYNGLHFNWKYDNINRCKRKLKNYKITLFSFL